MRVPDDAVGDAPREGPPQAPEPPAPHDDPTNAQLLAEPDDSLVFRSLHCKMSLPSPLFCRVAKYKEEDAPPRSRVFENQHFGPVKPLLQGLGDHWPVPRSDRCHDLSRSVASCHSSCTSDLYLLLEVQ